MLLKRIPSTVMLTGLLAAASVIPGATAASAQNPADPGRDHWDHVVTLNTLTAEGSLPFYLKIEFQVFDLKGKPGEAGTAEIWWSQRRRYEVVVSPSWNETSAPGEYDQPQTRQSYLIRALIEQILHPVQSARIPPASKIVEADRKFGKITLRCLSAEPENPTPSAAGLCVDPASDELRVNFDGGSVVLRNKMGKFRDTKVSLDLTASYGANKAITGKVVALKSITEDDEHIKPLPEPAAAAAPSHGGVVAGRKIAGKDPAYPYLARESHTQGTVVISATISKEGSIATPIVIASPDPALADAALSAVRGWKYEPYLLNGQPTEVDTTIEVNFSLGR